MVQTFAQFWQVKIQKEKAKNQTVPSGLSFDF
jgi:hypothetical protein